MSHRAYLMRRANTCYLPFGCEDPDRLLKARDPIASAAIQQIFWAAIQDSPGYACEANEMLQACWPDLPGWQRRDLLHHVVESGTDSGRGIQANARKVLGDMLRKWMLASCGHQAVKLMPKLRARGFSSR